MAIRIVAASLLKSVRSSEGKARVHNTLAHIGSRIYVGIYLPIYIYIWSHTPPEPPPKVYFISLLASSASPHCLVQMGTLWGEAPWRKSNKNKQNLEKTPPKKTKKTIFGDSLGRGPMEKTQKTKKTSRKQKNKKNKNKQYLGTLGWTPLSTKTSGKLVLVLVPFGRRIGSPLLQSSCRTRTSSYIKMEPTPISFECQACCTTMLCIRSRKSSLKAKRHGWNPTLQRFGHTSCQIRRRPWLSRLERKSLTDSVAMARKIRAARWTYWHKGQNAWNATINMLKDLRLRWCRECQIKKTSALLASILASFHDTVTLKLSLQTLPIMPRSDAINLGLAWRCASLRL